MPLTDTLRKVITTCENVVENIILWSRYLLIPLYLGLMYKIAIFSVDFFRILQGKGETAEEGAELTSHTMQVLQLLDNTMIANLIWFISAGSYYVFIHPYPNDSQKKKPRVLMHISTGILKEKMAGSIVGVSSIYLLERFLHLMQDTSLTPTQKITYAVGLHLAFVLGLLAFNHTNKADHHPHNQTDDNKEKPDAHH